MKWGKSTVNCQKHILGLMVIFSDIKLLFKNNSGFINNNEHVFFFTFIAFTRFRHQNFFKVFTECLLCSGTVA